MEHTTRTGEPKILRRCTLPITGLRVVHTIITELCVLQVTPEGLLLDELMPEVTVEDVRRVTEARLIVR